MSAEGLQPWHDPPRSKPGLTAALQQSFAVDPTALTAHEDITLAKWFRPLEEPVRSPQRLPAALNPATTISPFALTQPESVTVDRWWRPFSEPVRATPRVAFQLPMVAPVRQEDFTLDKWFRPLDLPRWPKRGLGAHLQQTTLADPAALTRHETITPDKWFRPFSEPVRRRPALRADIQEFCTPVQMQPFWATLAVYGEIDDGPISVYNDVLEVTVDTPPTIDPGPIAAEGAIEATLPVLALIDAGPVAAQGVITDDPLEVQVAPCPC